MTSTLLPTLPSVRAKELERAALLFAKESSSIGNNDEATAAQTSNATSGDETRRIPPVQSSLESSHSAMRNTDKAEQQQYRERKAEELTALHEKECTVFGGHPPLDSSVACNTIHSYVVTTCSYLNSFIADVTAADDGIDHKLSVLEKQIALLESKLASVPGLFPEDEDDDRVMEEGNVG